MSEDLKNTEAKLWEQFKSIHPDSDENINKKDEVLKKINEVRKSLNLPEWNKWTKDEAFKKLKEGGFNKSGFKFSPPRSSETKLSEITSFHDFVTKLYLSEVPEAKRKEVSIDHYRLDNLMYIDVLLQIFNGQTRQK